MTLFTNPKVKDQLHDLKKNSGNPVETILAALTELIKKLSSEGASKFTGVPKALSVFSQLINTVEGLAKTQNAPSQPNN